MRLKIIFAASWAVSLFTPVLAPAGDLLPIVADVHLQAQTSAYIFTATISATNNVDSWSVPVGPTYTPSFGAPAGAVGILIPPSWDATTQTLTWDSSGSTGGTYVWTVTASNSAGSDEGAIFCDVYGAEWYGGLAPVVDRLKLMVQSPLSDGGIVAGTITATENADEWGELLYPSYKTQQNGSVSTPSGIQTPNWNPTTQQFSWDMTGAHAGIYTWYVKARSIYGYSGAGSIEVHIAVPEPAPIVLSGIAIIAISTFRCSHTTSTRRTRSKI